MEYVLEKQYQAKQIIHFAIHDSILYEIPKNLQEEQIELP
jgi:hypothetical protein